SFVGMTDVCLASGPVPGLEGDEDGGHDRGTRVHHARWGHRGPILVVRLPDKLHLFVFPLVHGAGQRLFPDSGLALKLALAGSEAYSNGALHLTYRPAA